jgi:hypothetical protein
VTSSSRRHPRRHHADRSRARFRARARVDGGQRSHASFHPIHRVPFQYRFPSLIARTSTYSNPGFPRQRRRSRDARDARDDDDDDDAASATRWASARDGGDAGDDEDAREGRGAGR